MFLRVGWGHRYRHGGGPIFSHPVANPALHDESTQPRKPHSSPANRGNRRRCADKLILQCPASRLLKTLPVLESCRRGVEIRTTTSFALVDGKLTPCSGGDSIPVHLRLTVRTLWEGSVPDDVAVADCDLVSDNVPDGEYFHEYFYLKQHRQLVRVQAGKLAKGFVTETKPLADWKVGWFGGRSRKALHSTAHC